jgi:hypothetical protein
MLKTTSGYHPVLRGTVVPRPLVGFESTELGRTVVQQRNTCQLVSRSYQGAS